MKPLDWWFLFLLANDKINLCDKHEVIEQVDIEKYPNVMIDTVWKTNIIVS